MFRDSSLFIKLQLKRGKITESEYPKAAKTKSGRIMLLSKCAVCDSKKSNLLNSKNLEDYLVF